MTGRTGPDASGAGEGAPDDRASSPARRADRCRFSLPAAPPQLAHARALLQQWLTTAGWPADDAAMVIFAVNEALSDAIEHLADAPGRRADPARLPLIAVHGAIELAHNPPPALSVEPHGLGVDGAGATDGRRLRQQVRIEVVTHGRWRLAAVGSSSDHARSLLLLQQLTDQVLIDTTPDGDIRLTLIFTPSSGT